MINGRLVRGGGPAHTLSSGIESEYGHLRYVDFRNMIVSIHIPKTAGSSFRAGLEQQLGQRLLTDYEDRPLSDSLSDRWRRLRTRVKIYRRVDDLVTKYDAVHGHFIASKYGCLGDRAALCAFFRDPAERLLSQHRYWLSNPDPKNTMWVKFDARKMTPAQFASLPRQKKLYRLFTGGLPVERFTFVGITEEYETSLKLFRAIFGIDIPYRRVNVDAHVPNAIPPDQLTGVQIAQQANAQIYEAARRRFDTLCRRHLQR